MKKHQISKSGWTYNELWQGCILVSIAHAIFVADAPELAYQHSWDGFNYSTNSGQGSRGTITFHKEFFLAGFRNDEYSSDYLSARDYFVQAPEKVIELAEKETLQYLLEYVNGKVLPSVTIVLWGDKEQISSCHSFDNMIERGGDLLGIQSLNPDAAFEACEESYEFTEAQLSLLKKIFHQKIENPKDIIILTKNDISVIGANDEEGIYESKTLFAEIGIEW